MTAPFMVTGGSEPSRSNNQAAVAGLLRQKYLQSKAAAAARPATSAPSPPPGCPMHQPGGSQSSQASSSMLNPDNNIPFNLASSSSSSSGGDRLSSLRTVSSIPRGATSPEPGASPYDKPSACPVAHDSGASGPGPSRWEYPSPAQFQAALARKNKAAPEEHVETMVMVHNFLNEEAWKQVLEWEKHFVAKPEDVDNTSLLRFQGRPGELSPKARWYAFLGSVLPSRYASEPPFDRHDWIVGRADGTTARYVIDYYGDDEADARDEQRKQMKEHQRKQALTGAGAAVVEDDEDDDDDQANFVLDVRPAIDSFDALRVRASKAFSDWQSPQTVQGSA
ncbi:unnamed protein product [Parajaminaea phylloscopi]